MSSAGPVTSDSTIATGTSSSDSVQSVPTAADVAAVLEKHGWSTQYAEAKRRFDEYHKICNCSAFQERPKGHSIKCPARPRVDGVKGPYAKTQGNGERVGVQLDITGFPSRKLNPGLPSWMLKRYIGNRW